MATKKTENIQISCESEDLRRVDSLRRQFDTFPPSRSEIARVLLRYAVAKVEQEPALLKAISRLFGDAVIADIGVLAEFDLPPTDIQTERRARHCMSLTGCGYVDARAEFERAGGEELERTLYAPLRRQVGEKEEVA